MFALKYVLVYLSLNQGFSIFLTRGHIFHPLSTRGPTGNLLKFHDNLKSCCCMQMDNDICLTWNIMFPRVWWLTQKRMLKERRTPLEHFSPQPIAMVTRGRRHPGLYCTSPKINWNISHSLIIITPMVLIYSSPIIKAGDQQKLKMS
jgi:hypothetical protein